MGLGTQAALAVGRTHQLIARGALVGGGQIDVTPVWQVDNRAILAIDDQGRVTGVGSGSATVFATYGGMTATLVVHVGSDFVGAWTGMWSLVNCDAPQPAYCAERFPAGARRPLQLTITGDRIFAIPRLSWDLDGAPVSVAPSVTIGEDGSLSFGDRFFDARGFEVPLVVASFRGQLVGRDTLSARMTLLHGLFDAARTEWELVNATRAATSPALPPAPAPRPPATSVSALHISPLPTTVKVGSAHQLHATARFADGSAQEVQPEWIASSPSLAVSATGLLTARSRGNASVTARYQGLQATVSLLVVDDYSGTWRGTWRRLECFGPRCSEGDEASPTVELLIAQIDSLGPQTLSGVLSFGPWNNSRYVLAGRGSVGFAPAASLYLFWIERGPSGERLREISMSFNALTIDAGQRLSGRGSMTLREGEETTRVEFELTNLALVSRAVDERIWNSARIFNP